MPRVRPRGPARSQCWRLHRSGFWRGTIQFEGNRGWLGIRQRESQHIQDRLTLFIHRMRNREYDLMSYHSDTFLETGAPRRGPEEVTLGAGSLPSIRRAPSARDSIVHSTVPRRP